MTNKESENWLVENKLQMFTIQSFNYNDFSDKAEPFKKGVLVGQPNDLNNGIELDLELDLTLANL